MAKKNPKHAGKIPYATLVRQVKSGAMTQEVADSLVTSGAAAPSPRQDKFGEYAELVTKAETAIKAIAAEAGGKLTLRVVAIIGTPKTKKPRTKKV